jgi:hypothetical protein
MWTRNYLGGLAARLEPQGVRVQTHYVEGVLHATLFSQAM